MPALYEIYRPRTFAQVIGAKNITNCNILESKLKENKLPQALGFFGESGCGKTTTARIVAQAILKNSSLLKMQCHEYNMSHFTGVDDIREICESSKTLGFASLSSKRIFILDEVHRVSAQGQDALLKYLEDIPSHLIWILCTSAPDKLTKPIRGRLSQFEFERPTNGDISQYLLDIARQEKHTRITGEITLKIASKSQNVREACNFLENVVSLNTIDNESIDNFLVCHAEDESGDVFKQLFFPMLWGMNKISDDELITRYAKLTEKDCMSVIFTLGGLARNRILQGKYLKKANGESKDRDQIIKEFNSLAMILSFASDINYTSLTKPENKALLEFLRLIQKLRK